MTRLSHWQAILPTLVRDRQSLLARALAWLPSRQQDRSGLFSAAARGNVSQLENLLREGANPEVHNHHGDTPLHIAVRSRRYDAAACLLRYGASYTAENLRGQTPLAAPRIRIDQLHTLRQHCRRFATAEFTQRRPSSPQIAACLSELRETGIVKLSGLIGPEVLRRLRGDFHAFVEGLDKRLEQGEGQKQHYDEEEHYWADDKAYVSNNAFKHSAALVRLCCDSRLVELADLYTGCPAHITRAVAMRYLPLDERTNDMFGWHHDLDDRRLKALILLTDVGRTDQTMSYVAGSHQLFHPYEMFFHNTCSLDYCGRQLGRIDIRHTVGRAGDIFLFDSNGAHRGNRRPAARVRDALFVEYSADAGNVWGGDVPPGALDGMPREATRSLDHLLASPKKWQRRTKRKHPTWIEQLPQVESWIAR